MQVHGIPVPTKPDSTPRSQLAIRGIGIDTYRENGAYPDTMEGQVLDARDVMQVLHNDPLAPADLREKSLRLAGRMIEWDPAVRGGQGLEIARDILASGRALHRMDAIIAAQGTAGFDYRHPALGQRSFDVLAAKSGVVTLINNLQLAHIAGHAGAPKVKSAGVDLHCKLGQTVGKGDLLYRVHARYGADLEFARKARETSTGYTIGSAQDVPQVSVEF